MKTFAPLAACLATLLVSAAAFAPSQTLKVPSATWVKSPRAPVMRMGLDAQKIMPALMFSAPAIAADDVVSNLPMATSLEVTFAAYLAVLLGTFLPVAFLIILYLNSEARKVGEFSQFEDLE